MSFSKLTSYHTLTHAIAGAAGGFTAMSVFYPLDTVRSRLQIEEGRASKNTFLVMKDLVEEEGVETLYRGIRPVLESLCCSNFIYFYTFHGLRSLVSFDNLGHKAASDLLMSSIAGVLNVLVTNPLWVANSRIKMQGANLRRENSNELRQHPVYHGLLDAVIKIKQTEGCQALWSSLVPSLMLVVNPAVQFTVYEALKAEMMKKMQTKELGGVILFLIGAVSKSIATILTYPLQHVQQKLRTGGSEKLRKMNIIQVFVYLIRLYGFKGLFKGLEAKLIQTVFTAALMFLCYEKIAATVFQVMGTNK